MENKVIKEIEKGNNNLTLIVRELNFLNRDETENVVNFLLRNGYKLSVDRTSIYKVG